jgi:serine/threonine-protein kinase
MANILYVDDDVELAKTVGNLLKFEKHAVDMVHTGLEGREKACTNEYDLLILDWDLPDINGINILRRFREAGGRAPVMMLTGHGSASDKELGLDTGADDYVTKPFDMIELAARVRALLRRAQSQAPVNKPLGSGNEEVLKKGKLSGTALASKYEFLEVLGEGGCGIVFKVRHPVMEKLMAVKMLLAENMKDLAMERFKREAKAISRLEHPNIINIQDFGVTESGQPYMVMDFVEGVDLGDLISKKGALPVSFAIDLAVQICDAMSHAHSLNILHRDLKPNNVMLKCFTDRQPIPKILDFGLAKLSDFEQEDSVKLTKLGQMFGSPPYMSPEQIDGKPLDERSDIYSLGCVLYEMLTGVPPHLGESVSQILLKHLQSPAPLLAEMRPDLRFPDRLDPVVQKALEKSPDNRYQSMLELQKALLQVLPSQPATTG